MSVYVCYASMWLLPVAVAVAFAVAVAHTHGIRHDATQGGQGSSAEEGEAGGS